MQKLFFNPKKFKVMQSTLYDKFIFRINLLFNKVVMVNIQRYITSMKLQIILVFALAFVASPVRIFLMGGNVSDNETQIYTTLAVQTGKKPNPNNCEDNWATTTCPKIAVVTSAAQSQAVGNQAYNIDQSGSLSYRNLFRKYGFSPKHVSIHIDNYKTAANLSSQEGQANYDILKNADIIFFNGGDQARHSRSWLEDSGEYNAMMTAISAKIFDNSVILAGTSAGTMVMCSPAYGGGSSFGQLYFAESVGLAPKSVKDGAVNGTGLYDTRNGTKSLQYQQNGGFLPGFKLAPFLLDTHFDARGRIGRLIPGMLQLNFGIGVGIDQSTCLYYNKGIGKVLGKSGVTIADIRSAFGNRQQYFSISNATIHYLTSGDTFDFSNSKIVSSKQAIKNPYYSGHKDSNNILGYPQYETTVTRLVDQSASYNIGYTKTPSGYPSKCPVFKLYFQKDSNSAGFYNKDNKKYTAANIKVDFAYQ